MKHTELFKKSSQTFTVDTRQFTRQSKSSRLERVGNGKNIKMASDIINGIDRLAKGKLHYQRSLIVHLVPW